MAGSKRTLYVGTSARQAIGNLGRLDAHSDDGLFRVSLNGDVSQPEFLGLEGRGGVRGQAIVGPDDPDRIIVGTGASGIFATDDGGRSWHEHNEGLRFKEVWSLTRHPSTGELYAGVAPATIFRSTDQAASWTELSQCRAHPSVRQWTFPGPPFMSHVKSIGLHADDPDLIFAAVEEGWLLRSTDHGKSWENLRDGTDIDSHTAYPMPDNPQVVVSTAGKGVFRSKDGGDTFVDANEGLERRYMIGFALHPDNPQRLFTTAAEVPPPFWVRPEGASAAFYRSDDQGESWHKVTEGLPEWLHEAPRSVAADPIDPDRFYVGMIDGSIWWTDDGAQSFRPLVEGLPAASAITVVAA